MTGSVKILDGLTALILANRPNAQDLAIDALNPVAGGNSSEIWSFDARWQEDEGPVSHKLILRRASPTEFKSCGRDAEYRLLRSLEHFDIPTPRMLWLDPDGQFLDRPSMVMERLPGRSDRHLLNASERALSKASRLNLASAISELLAAVHRIDIATLDIGQDGLGSKNPALEQLAIYDSEIRRLELEPMPQLRLASLWLHDHLPPAPERLALVHGDFRPANLLVEGGRITALLDWEFAHVGDPAEDLGWYLTPYYRDEHFIAGQWSPDSFLERYEAALARPVDRRAIEFWAVFAMYKLACMTLAAQRAFIDGDASRLTPSSSFIVAPLSRSLVADGRLQ